jgi:ParB-like chromosome segregation protein Spo0J
MSTSRSPQMRRHLAVEYRPPECLKRDPTNARKHSKKQIAKLQAGISEFGFVSPILIDEHCLIIAGHARHDAAVANGMKQVPCIELIGLSEAQKRALAIADNKLGDESEFDVQILAATLAELGDVDFSVELTGFDTAEIDVLLDHTASGSAGTADPLDDVAPPDPSARSFPSCPTCGCSGRTGCCAETRLRKALTNFCSARIAPIS